MLLWFTTTSDEERNLVLLEKTSKKIREKGLFYSFQFA